MSWIILVTAAIGFGVGFLVGKFDSVRRMTKWLASLPEADQTNVRSLLRNSPTSLS
jgi:uncharacterized protein YneF (UPF0154 family)